MKSVASNSSRWYCDYRCCCCSPLLSRLRPPKLSQRRHQTAASLPPPSGALAEVKNPPSFRAVRCTSTPANPGRSGGREGRSTGLKIESVSENPQCVRSSTSESSVFFFPRMVDGGCGWIRAQRFISKREGGFHLFVCFFLLSSRFSKSLILPSIVTIRMQV